MIKSYFELTKYDQDQSYLCKTRRKRSRSFVQGFLKAHYLWFQYAQGVGVLSITDTSGTGRSFSAPNGSTSFFRASTMGRGSANYYTPSVPQPGSIGGIVVGTGTTAVAPTDYQLATQIADGITSGTLEYFSSSGSGTTISAPTGSFTLERLFRNSSGASITINEVGVYCMYVGYSVCMIRDLVSPGFAVGNGEYMRVVYTITVTA